MTNENRRIKYPAILLRELVKTDFKLRYQGSVLGYLWSLLKPLFLFGILYIVFVVIVRVDYGVENSGIYLLLGIVLWSFFAELTGGSVTSIVGKGDLIRKLNFPKSIIVLAIACSAAINLLLNILVVIIFMFISRVGFNIYQIFAPLLLIELFVFGTAIGFFLSATYVQLRDIGHIWEVFMQALFYMTPILFPVSFAPLWGQKILMLNPMAQIVQDFRYIFVSRDTTTIVNVYGNNQFARIIPIAIVLGVFAISWTYFKRRSRQFAENI